jgi:hypothetical protein
MDCPEVMGIALANGRLRSIEIESPSDGQLESIQIFLERLETLTSMRASLPTASRDQKPCPRCQERLFPLRTGALMWREVEDGAHNLQCPICQFLFDWLPVQKLSTLRREREFPNTIRAVLKVGRLDRKHACPVSPIHC